VVAAASNDDTIVVMRGNGDGTFRAAQAFPGAALSATSISIADLDSDGKLDVATADGADLVSVFLGNGDGTLRPSLDFTASGVPTSIAVADFDGDGDYDLAVSELTLPDVNLLFGGCAR